MNSLAWREIAFNFEIYFNGLRSIFIALVIDPNWVSFPSLIGQIYNFLNEYSGIAGERAVSGDLEATESKLIVFAMNSYVEKIELSGNRVLLFFLGSWP